MISFNNFQTKMNDAHEKAVAEMNSKHEQDTADMLARHQERVDANNMWLEQQRELNSQRAAEYIDLDITVEHTGNCEANHEQLTAMAHNSHLIAQQQTHNIMQHQQTELHNLTTMQINQMHHNF